jgi:CheY-like chemotaxis protein
MTVLAFLVPNRGSECLSLRDSALIRSRFGGSNRACHYILVRRSGDFTPRGTMAASTRILAQKSADETAAVLHGQRPASAAPIAAAAVAGHFNDVPADPAVPAKAPFARAAPAHTGTETILVVEDEAGIRNLVRRVLSNRGYQVLEAGDVTQAAAIGASHPRPIDLLLSDVVMPVMNGPELARHIVSQRPGIRVLFMSGFSSRHLAELGAEAGTVRMLPKPFTPDGLARTVRECLDDGAGQEQR